MFERSDLERLAAHEGEHPVVSLYLNLPPHLRGTPEAYRARLRTLLRQINGRAPEDDITAVERYFEHDFDWAGQGAAVFSSQADGLWAAYQFAVPLRSHVHVGRKPFIMPLADLIDTYGSYTVAVLDQQSLSLYHFHLGELVKSSQMAGDEVRSVNAPGGNRQAGRTRGEPTDHKRELVRSNLKKFVDALDTFARQHKAESLLLGGTETNIAQFREMLPPPWRDRLQGGFPISSRASETEVRDRSLEALHAAHKARQEKLVESIRVAAAKAANGTVGMDDTLLALHAGRVQTLALVEGLEVPGYQCNGCGYLTIHDNGACPYCGNTFRPVENAAEHAVRRVVEQGGGIEFMEEDSQLVEIGGIAALLRY